MDWRVLLPLYCMLPEATGLAIESTRLPCRMTFPDACDETT